MRFLGVLVFLIPFFLGLAVVTDYRGFARVLMQPSRNSSGKGPATVHVIAGSVLMAISGLGFLAGVVIAVREWVS
ncbi:hypothetical protein [Kitasatospora sp. NPDC089509]|uniref:hypothetical protein n=1 Tax=Kitasatospora sp. NPDC089509 TaxID=3364079 RepID=UPI00382591CF